MQTPTGHSRDACPENIILKDGFFSLKNPTKNSIKGYTFVKKSSRVMTLGQTVALVMINKYATLYLEWGPNKPPA